jgi:hypothetical protein
MSDDNQPFLWNDIDELPKVSSGGKVMVIANTFLWGIYPPPILIFY